MPFDPITGKIKRTDIFGKKVSLKEYRREVLAENKRKGRSGENRAIIDNLIEGKFVKRTGIGSDYSVERIDLNTMKMEHLGYEEVKTGNSKLSKRQQEMKKKFGKKYHVRRYLDDPFL